MSAHDPKAAGPLTVRGVWTRLAHRLPRSLPLCAALAAVAGLGVAAEPKPAGGADTQADELAKAAAAHQQGAEAAGSYHYEMGKKALSDNRVIDAVEELTKAVDYQPDNKEYRNSLAQAQGIAGQARGARDVYINRVADELSVNQQRLWAEAQTHVEEGQKQLEKGDYAEAERSFQLAYTRLESLPYADERREPEMRRLETLLAETRQRRARQELQEAGNRNRTAEDRQREIREYSLRLERTRIEEMMVRAEKARSRRDYDDAIVLLEQILKLNRAYEPAHDLLVRCRRERHVYLRQVTADRWDEEHKLLSEQIRTWMLPQMEILAYSHDWPEIDARRTAPTQGLDEEHEEWRDKINKQLEQQVTLDFQDTDLTEVIASLQRFTGINFVVDPQVTATPPPPVNLKVNEMKVRFVLDYIAQITSLKYSIQGEAIYISTTAGSRGDLYMKVYNIRDLMIGVTPFPGPDLSIPQGGGTGSKLLPPVDAEPPAPEVSELIDIIKKVVAPDTWGKDDVPDPTDFQGALVITQTAAVHKEIDTLLRSLRAERGTQIHVKVKFLTVENSLLEEIGVDWNNFTGGNAANPVVPPNATTQSPGPLGAYNADGAYTVAGVLNNQLQGYNTDHSLPLPQPNEGLTFHAETFHFANGLFASAVLHAVEKTRRGNVMFEPDITLFNGQQAHIVNMNQQAYVGDFEVNQGQFTPVVQTLSYGTVLDVQAVASADRKYITLTLRPTNAQVIRWRRFGPPITDPNNQFPGGPVVQPTQANLSTIGGSPLMLPELGYQAVRTSVTIPDGGSLLIAGMTNGESSRSHAGIPFLSHIPFLGRLFSSNGRQETELRTLVMVSADIVIFDEIEKKL